MMRSVGMRLHWATVTAIVAIGALLATVYTIESSRLREDRAALLRAVVDSAREIAIVYEREERAGNLTRAEAQQGALKAIGAIRYHGNEYVWVNDLHPRIVMHPIKPEMNGEDVSDFKDPNGKRLFVAFADAVRANGNGLVDYLWPRPGSAQPVPKLSFVAGFQPWDWVIGTGVYVDDLVTARRQVAMALAGLGITAALIVGLVIWFLGRSVARPTRTLAGVTERLSRGDLSVAIGGLDRPDEFGTLARALDILKESSAERVRLEHAAVDDRAAKDRRQAAMEHLTQDFGRVISGVLTQLTQAARNMSDTAREMTRGTERTQASATDTADGSTTSARDLSAVAAATVELSASVDEIARQVAHASDATREAVERASATNVTFVNLSDMAERIGDVGGAISRIAAQTNLLALNATIEAARAGEAGKGFAVVANEVKTLAAQTARATAEIGQNVTAIRTATEHTATAIQEVSSAIGRVDSVSAAIAAAIEEQGATTREIAANVQTVALTGERTASAMAEVAAIAQGSGEMSQTVLAASEDIAQVAHTLREEVDHFLQAMARDDGARRRYERIPGQDAPATLSMPGRPDNQVTIHDISRGGAALTCRQDGKIGSEVRLRLPGAREPVTARIVRHDNGLLGIAFRQDEATVHLLDAALDALSSPGATRRAA